MTRLSVVSATGRVLLSGWPAGGPDDARELLRLFRKSHADAGLPCPKVRFARIPAGYYRLAKVNLLDGLPRS